MGTLIGSRQKDAVANKRRKAILIATHALAIALGFVIYHTYCCFFCIYNISFKYIALHGVWIIILLYAVFIGLFTNDTQECTYNDNESLNEQLLDNSELRKIFFEKENAWNKSLFAISSVLLSSCAFCLFNWNQSPIVDFTIVRSFIGVIALLSIFNMAQSSLIHLHSYFLITYKYQKDVWIHRFLKRLCVHLSPFWHLLSLFSCFAIIYCVTFVVVTLAF